MIKRFFSVFKVVSINYQTRKIKSRQLVDAPWFESREEIEDWCHLNKIKIDPDFELGNIWISWQYFDLEIEQDIKEEN